ASGAAGVEAVVLDHVDAGFLRGVDDGAAGAGVDAREHDHARVGRDRLLGLGLLSRRVTLGVHDGVLGTGIVKGLVEVRTVVALPPGRARAVREENPDLLVTRTARSGSTRGSGSGARA